MCNLALFVAVLVAQAHVERRYRTTASQHITLVVDSIDYRRDLTHCMRQTYRHAPYVAAHRRNDADPPGSRARKAVEISTALTSAAGFSGRRDGVIAVEIDFEAMAPVKGWVITINTPRGVDTMRIDRP